MNKNKIIHTKNLIAALLFRGLKIFFNKRTSNGEGILFVHIAPIGDLLLSSIIIRNSSLFNSQICFLINKKYAEVYKDYDDNVKIICVNSSLYKWILPYRIYFIRKIRKQNFEISINLNHNKLMISDELTFLSSSKLQYALSYETANVKRNFTASLNKTYDQIFFGNEKNEYEKIIVLIKKLTQHEPVAETIFFISEKTKHFIEDKFYNFLNIRSNYKLVTIAPLASTNIKSYPIEYYEDLINRTINLRDCNILLLGDKKQKTKLNEIVERINSPKIINAAGDLSIVESGALISRSNLFIGNDSGLLHIAKALKVPNIGIIGGGSFNIFHPYYIGVEESYLFSEMDCFGCEWKCKYDKPLCLHEVNVDEVFNKVKSILK